jgi:hypothetical protein
MRESSDDRAFINSGLLGETQVVLNFVCVDCSMK